MELHADGLISNLTDGPPGCSRQRFWTLYRSLERGLDSRSAKNLLQVKSQPSRIVTLPDGNKLPRLGPRGTYRGRFADMEKNRSKLGLGIVIGSLGLLVLLGIIGLVVVYTGAYNVAATEQHMSVTRWAFDTTMHQSVKQRAADVNPVETITPAMITAGASAYKSMCQHCHAGPGVDREKWADGMRPRPPHLAEAAAEWEPSEVYWIVRHGIKMSGMPAFGPSHDESTLWGIAAFVKELPAMTPERYASLGKGAGAHATGNQATGGHHGATDTASSGAAEPHSGDGTRR